MGKVLGYIGFQVNASNPIKDGFGCVILFKFPEDARAAKAVTVFPVVAAHRSHRRAGQRFKIDEIKKG